MSLASIHETRLSLLQVVGVEDVYRARDGQCGLPRPPLGRPS